MRWQELVKEASKVRSIELRHAKVNCIDSEQRNEIVKDTYGGINL